MFILPVIDLQGGLVVRGVGGRRREYRPLDTPGPVDVARGFAGRFGLRELYLADLSAIERTSAPAWEVYAALHRAGFALWLDAGVRDAAEGEALAAAAAGVGHVVAGLETLAGPEALRGLVASLGRRVVFSLDLKDNRPILPAHSWPGHGEDVFAIAREAVGCGVRRVIVLDLARVGAGAGTGTEELCARLVESFPEVEVIAGGGVRGADDLRRLRSLGVRGALVASALHDGRLTRADLEAL